jgi:energy-converting hydrogenase Eha subunit H
VTLFLRSYLISLGFLLGAGGVGALLLDCSGKLSIGWLGGIVAVAIALFGTVLLFVGMFGSPARVEVWVDWTSVHEGSIVLAIVALPLFLILRLFQHMDRRPPVTLPITEIRGKRAERRQRAELRQKRHQ